MAITKVAKSFDEYDVQVTPFLKVSDIDAPHEQFQVAGYIPVALGRKDAVNDEYFTIEGGRVVAITATSDSATGRWENRLTLANGGSAQTYTYSADDIGRTEDIDNPDNLVTLADASSLDDAANLPIGIAPYPYYQGTLVDRLRNYELQPTVAVWNTAYCEFPVLFDEQDTGATALVDGCAIMSGDQGQIIRFQHGTDSVDQLIGRCWVLSTIAATGGLDKVHTVRGLGLSGTDTSGIPAHLNLTHVDDVVAATLKFRAVINAAP
jgi:hypothetical protein